MTFNTHNSCLWWFHNIELKLHINNLVSDTGIRDPLVRLAVVLSVRRFKEPSWQWMYGSWIYSYLSPLMLWVRLPLRVRNIILCDKVCQWLAAVRWFSPGPPVSSTYKTDRNDITEILLKVALNTIKPTNQIIDLKASIYPFCMLKLFPIQLQWTIYDSFFHLPSKNNLFSILIGQLKRNFKDTMNKFTRHMSFIR